MNVPNWVSRRGGEVRVFDRRTVDSSGLPGQVGGPSHHFLETTDLLVTNGMLRFWVGNSMLPAFLNVEAFVTGAWRAAGTLMLSSSDVLLSARLARLSNEAGTVALDIRNQGTVYCTLRRGERGVRITHGSGLSPSISATRAVRWSGTPPVHTLSNVQLEEAIFDSGLGDSWGMARFFWPQDLLTGAWSVGCAFQPYTHSGSRGPIDVWGEDDWGDGEWGGSGLGNGAADVLYIEDSGGVIGSVRYDGASDRFVFTLGAQTLLSDELQFDALDALRVVARFSTTEGMALTVRADSGTSHTSDPLATDPGTSEDTYYALGIGPSSGAVGGIYDQAMVFEDRLTDNEAGSLVEQASRTASLPVPEARLVWFAPFDVGFAPAGFPSSGRVSGATDEWGLTRVVVALRSSSGSGLGLSKNAEIYEVGAYLTTGATQDTPADVHAQFAAISEQELMLR